MRSFRIAALLALTGAALSAQADVRYSFISPVEEFSFTLNSLITSTTTIQASQLDFSSFNGGPPAAVSVVFTPNGFMGFDVLRVNNFFGNAFANEYLFTPGSFSTFGTHNFLAPFPGSLTVTDLSSVPGPASALPFALLALRRRKRA